MYALRLRPETKWLAPEPLWFRRDPNTPAAQPAILRFDSDDFMDDLQSVLDERPRDLHALRARPETWREPLPSPNSAPTEIPEEAFGEPLRLYQSGHQRYYLVTGSLVELTRGLADRCVERGRGQAAQFVVRRMVPKDPENPSPIISHEHWREHAFVKTKAGFRWRALPEGGEAELEVGEHVNPMFPVSFQAKDVRRVLYAGLIPVAKREAYLAAPPEAPTDTPPGVERMRDPRRVRLNTDVLGPWSALMELGRQEHRRREAWKTGTRPKLASDAGPHDDGRDAVNIVGVFEQFQTGSWYVGHDLLRFLAAECPRVFAQLSIDAGLPASPPTLEPAESALYAWLDTVRYGSSWFAGLSLPNIGEFTHATSLRDFLVELLKIPVDFEDAEADLLERADRSFHFGPVDARWPTVLFPLAHTRNTDGAGPRAGTSSADALLEELETRIVNALPELSADAVTAPETGLANEWDKNDSWFLVRCVFDDPNCLPFHGPTISAPTRFFQLAPFFDPDAPARPVRIALPVDVSPAGLRKYAKSANLVVSDLLCSKIKAIRGYTLGDFVLHVLPWPFHKSLQAPEEAGPCVQDDATTFGMVCSLSIPIVTLVALILLMIIVSLLDYFFRWLPFLFICFPIPGLKTKKGT